MCIGPAGTGKTESVKALGHQLGRFVLVFNCDETFDFQVCAVLAILKSHWAKTVSTFCQTVLHIRVMVGIVLNNAHHLALQLSMNHSFTSIITHHSAWHSGQIQLTTTWLPRSHSQRPPYLPLPILIGHGSYLCGSVPGGSMGLLRWVRGENVVCRLTADPDNPGVSQGEATASVKWVVQLCACTCHVVEYKFQALSPAAYLQSYWILLFIKHLFSVSLYNVYTITRTTNVVERTAHIHVHVAYL